MMIRLFKQAFCSHNYEEVDTYDYEGFKAGRSQDLTIVVKRCIKCGNEFEYYRKKVIEGATRRKNQNSQ